MTIPQARETGAELWPVFEFRPRDCHSKGTVLRYAEGQWIPDDGEYDIAFVSYGMGAPLGLYVQLPYQRNILWSGLTTDWRAHVAAHPRGNPWHYMLREGASDWGGTWGRDAHLNERVGRKAMNKCCALNGCANGRGPEFVIGDPYITLGLVRNRATQETVRVPTYFDCMYCGEGWRNALLAQAMSSGGRAPA